MIRNNNKEKNKQISTEMDERSNLLLRNFLATIKNVEKSKDDLVLDVLEVMDNQQATQFKELEEIVSRIFTSKTLCEALQKTIEETNLSNEQQVSTLAIMKIFETLMVTMERINSMPNANTMYA